MLTGICDILLELHRGCRNRAGDDFLIWAMSLVGKMIPHDACFWETGAVVEGEIVVHTSWMKNISAESILVWKRHKHAVTSSSKLLENAGKVVNFIHAELQKESAYEPLCRPLGVEQLLGIYFPNERTCLHDAISLCRSCADTPFSELERLALEGLVPHLIEARRINYLSGMRSAGAAAIRYKGAAAADFKGVLHAIDDDFLRVAQLEWPHWRGPVLPEPLRAMLQEGTDTVFCDKTVVRYARVSDMFYLDIRARTPVDDLSEREREIGHFFARGRTHKAIARNFDISPSTVRNHLSAIYRKLGIRSKAELATLFSKSRDFPNF